MESVRSYILPPEATQITLPRESLVTSNSVRGNLADSLFGISRGRHYYAFPFLLLWDNTDAGHAWDVAAAYWAFWYSEAEGFVAATGTTASVDYLNFAGRVRCLHKLGQLPS